MGVFMEFFTLLCLMALIFTSSKRLGMKSGDIKLLFQEGLPSAEVFSYSISTLFSNLQLCRMSILTKLCKLDSISNRWKGGIHHRLRSVALRSRLHHIVFSGEKLKL